MKRLLARWLFERGGLVVLVVFAMYLWIAPSHITTGDNAEFATLGTTGGAAHPTGYPLYLLWLRAWSWLPGTPAHAAAIATCILGGLALLALHAACRAWGASSVSASFAIAMTASVPVIVRIHTEAEVFAMNGLVATVILLLAAQAGPLRGAWRATALAFVAGLGISDHVTCVLLMPIGILGLVRGLRETTRPRWLIAIACIGALAVGLIPYLYLLVTPDTRASWGKVVDLHQLLRHFLRSDYGGPSELGPRDRGGQPGPNILSLIATHARAYLWLPFAAGVAAFAHRIVRSARQSDTRVAWSLLAASWLLAGPILVSRFNLPPSGHHLFITSRFHVLPTIVFAVPVAVGLDAVARWVFSRWSPALVQHRAAAILAPVLLAVTLVGVALPRITGARSVATEQGLRNLLATLPANSVVIGVPDDFHFGMGYLQGALHLRPDVVVITWPQMGIPYARAHVKNNLGITIEEARADEQLSVTVAAQILATGRPLFIDPFMSNIAKAYPIYPLGLVYRVLPRGTPVPTIRELFDMNKQLFDRFTFGYPTPRRSDVVPAQVHEHYARTWHIIADGLGKAGLVDEQRYALRMAMALAPED